MCTFKHHRIPHKLILISHLCPPQLTHSYVSRVTLIWRFSADVSAMPHDPWKNGAQSQSLRDHRGQTSKSYFIKGPCYCILYPTIRTNQVLWNRIWNRLNLAAAWLKVIYVVVCRFNTLAGGMEGGSGETLWFDDTALPRIYSIVYLMALNGIDDA